MMMARLNNGESSSTTGSRSKSPRSPASGVGKAGAGDPPHRSHVIDAHAFRERLELKSFAPEAERTEIERRVPVDGSTHQLKLDDSVWVESLEGSKNSEPILVVKSGGRTASSSRTSS